MNISYSIHPYLMLQNEAFHFDFDFCVLELKYLSNLFLCQIFYSNKRVYHYSMQQMSSTATNPIDNFTGGCLGYFSAHSEIVDYKDFYYSDVTEDDE